MEKSNKNFLNILFSERKVGPGLEHWENCAQKSTRCPTPDRKRKLFTWPLCCCALRTDGKSLAVDALMHFFFSFSARRARAPWKRHPNARTRVISFQMKRIQVEGTLFFFFFCVGTADGCWPVARWCQVPQTVCNWNFVRTLRHWAKCPKRLFIWITLNGKV